MGPVSRGSHVGPGTPGFLQGFAGAFLPHSPLLALLSTIAYLNTLIIEGLNVRCTGLPGQGLGNGMTPVKAAIQKKSYLSCDSSQKEASSGRRDSITQFEYRAQPITAKLAEPHVAWRYLPMTKSFLSPLCERLHRGLVVLVIPWEARGTIRDVGSPSLKGVASVSVDPSTPQKAVYCMA